MTTSPNDDNKRKFSLPAFIVSILIVEATLCFAPWFCIAKGFMILFGIEGWVIPSTVGLLFVLFNIPAIKQSYLEIKNEPEQSK